MQEYRKNLDALSSAVLRAYLDSVMFLIIVPIANDKRKTRNFLFYYQYYSNRERAIIAAKSLIEPQGKNKLTIEKVIKDLQQNIHYNQYADEMYSRYKELFDSEEAKRVKKFRDSLCHKIKENDDIERQCDDILMLIDDVRK